MSSSSSSSRRRRRRSEISSILVGLDLSPSGRAALQWAAQLAHTSLGEWSVATQALEELLGHNRISLVAVLQAANREGGGQSAGS
jgi:hypothetical protein